MSLSLIYKLKRPLEPKALLCSWSSVKLTMAANGYQVSQSLSVKTTVKHATGLSHLLLNTQTKLQ